jgi:ribosomal RNA-processing protein 1
MLVRRFVNAMFRLLIRANWDGATLQKYHSILMKEGGPLW